MLSFVINANNLHNQTADADWQTNGLTLLYSFQVR